MGSRPDYSPAFRAATRTPGEPAGPGDASALDARFREAYDELRRIAARRLSAERRGHTLNPTALINEAWLRMAADPSVLADDRAAFLAAAANVMRRILVDHARTKGRAKRGGRRQRLTLDTSHLALADTPVDLLTLDEALRRLELEALRPARIVELRFFGGLSEHEIATSLGISRTTVQTEWRYARARLRRDLAASEAENPRAESP